MKTAGIIGGIGPESTIEYYRSIVTEYRRRTNDGSYPSVVINSIDLKKLIDWIEAGDLSALTGYLVDAAHRLAAAGAEFGAIAANTPHIVFDAVARASPIPFISIVEATCEAAKAAGLITLALFGTRFTMEGRFYPDVFSRKGMTLTLPAKAEQAYIHDKYMGELVKGTVVPETRERLLAIADRMIDTHGIQGLILGGTELSLILSDDAYRGIPLLDTTRIHANAIVEKLLS